MVSRFGIGWLLGTITMVVYYELRSSLPFWLILVAAILLVIVGGHLTEKHLSK